MASKCKSCGYPIKSIETIEGHKMPVNPELITVIPDPAGKMIVVKPDGEVVRGSLAMAGTPGAVRGYTSHFATCPQADQWRK